MENQDGSNESDNPQQQTKSDSELWDFPKTDPIRARFLVNRFILACPAPGRDVDIEIFKAQVCEALVMVPPEVSESVMDPKKGLAVKIERFPVAYTVRDAIAAEMAPYYRLWERRKRKEEFKRVASPPIPEYQNRKQYHETLHDKFKHLNSTSIKEMPEGPEKEHVLASVAARAAETIAFLKGKRTKSAEEAAASIQALAEEITGKPL